MEDPKKNSRNQNKKKMAIKIGGSGGGVNVGGFILLGGALAAATFLGSAFAIKTRRRRSNGNNQLPPPPPPPAVPIDPPSEMKLEKNNKNEIRKGITFILPDSSKNETAKIDVTQIESEPLGSTQILILDEKPKLESNGDDIPKEPESLPLLDESAISKNEFSSPVFDNLLPGDVKDNESAREIEVITNLGEAIEADNAGQIVLEESEGDGDGNIAAEKCKEGSETANVEMEIKLNQEQESATNGDQEIIYSFDASEVKPEYYLPVVDNPADLEPEDVNKNEELGRPLSAESDEVIERDEEFEATYGDQLTIEGTPRINAHEFKQQECLMAVFDSPTALEPENASTDGERPLSTESEQVAGRDEELEAAYGNQAQLVDTSLGSNSVFDNPTDLVPEDVNKNEELERPMSAESEQVTGRVEEFEAAYGDQHMIEETPQFQLNEEQESPTSGDQEVNCSDSLIPRINVCEVKQQDCSMAVFDGPTAFELENASTNEERPLVTESDQAIGRDEESEASNGDRIPIKANQQILVTEELKEEEYGDIVVDKYEVVVEALHSAQITVEDDQEALVNGDQEISPSEKPTPENVKQDDDSTEIAVKVMKEDEAIASACVYQIEEEGNSPMQLIEEEQKEDSDGRCVAVEEGKEDVETVVTDTAAVDDNPQTQFSEEGGEEIDEEEINDDADDEEEIGDTDDEDRFEKVEESSEESNAEAIWPAEESMQEFPQKFKELKINNQNSVEKTEEKKRVETEEDSYNNNGEKGELDADDYKINEDKRKLSMTYIMEMATKNDQAVDSWKQRVWISSILVALVLVLLLLHRPTLIKDLFTHDSL